MTHQSTSSALLELAEREAIFLEILSTMPCGQADASDGYHNWINAFCEEHEKRDPDTFNRMIDGGYIDWWHDSDSDNSTINLTEKGRDFLRSRATGAEE